MGEFFFGLIMALIFIPLGLILLIMLWGVFMVFLINTAYIICEMTMEKVPEWLNTLKEKALKVF